MVTGSFRLKGQEHLLVGLSRGGGLGEVFSPSPRAPHKMFSHSKAPKAAGSDDQTKPHKKKNPGIPVKTSKMHTP